MATYTVRMPDGSESTHRSLSGAQSAVRSGGFDSYTVDDRTSRGLLGGGRTTGVSADRSARDVRRDLGGRAGGPVFGGGGGLLGGLFGGGGQRTPQAGDGALFGYNSFNDMIDGGGPGASGDRFQGGGLVSLLANILARPRQTAQMQAGPGLAPQGTGMPAAMATPRATPQPATPMQPAAGLGPTINPYGQYRGGGATPATAYSAPTPMNPIGLGLSGPVAGLLPPGTDLPGRLPTYDPALRPTGLPTSPPPSAAQLPPTDSMSLGERAYADALRRFQAAQRRRVNAQPSLEYLGAY